MFDFELMERSTATFLVSLPMTREPGEAKGEVSRTGSDSSSTDGRGTTAPKVI